MAGGANYFRGAATVGDFDALYYAHKKAPAWPAAQSAAGVRVL